MGCGEGLNVRLGVRSRGCRLQRALWDLSESLGFFPEVMGAVEEP